MITESDSIHTIDLGNYYAILPSVSHTYSEKEFMAHHKAKKYLLVLVTTLVITLNWLNVDSLRKLIKLHVDPSLKI